MAGVVSRPTFAPQAAPREAFVGLWAGRWSPLLGAVVALATLAATAQTRRGQGAKAPAGGSGPPAKAKAGTTPEELYGDQGGEKLAPANARLPNTVMRARLEDTFFKLSNPREGQTSGKAKRNALLV